MNKNNATIVYYSSNMEDPNFENRIKETILKNCGNLSIISVTQKPINFGKNICVGDNIGVSGFNLFRQVQIGCEEAKTQFVISAEADTLYPPDYFEFIPPKEDVCYRNSNLYVMPDLRDYYFKKSEGATHAQIVGREYYIEKLKELFKDAPQWSIEEKNFPKERHRKEDIFDKIEYWETENPVVQIKTGDSLRYYTHSERIPINSLKYWGNGKTLRQYYITRKRIFK